MITCIIKAFTWGGKKKKKKRKKYIGKKSKVSKFKIQFSSPYSVSSYISVMLGSLSLGGTGIFYIALLFGNHTFPNMDCVNDGGLF